MRHAEHRRLPLQGLLEKGPSEANAFLQDPDKYIEGVRASADAAAREQLSKVSNGQVSEILLRSASCTDCSIPHLHKLYSGTFAVARQATFVFCSRPAT